MKSKKLWFWLLIIAFAAALSFPGAAFAQNAKPRVSIRVGAPTVAGSHSGSLAWGASATAGLSGYKVYRAPCTGSVDDTTHLCGAEGAFSVLTAVGPDVFSFVDINGLLAGTKWVWYVTAYIDNATQFGESQPTNHWAAVIPKDTVLVAAPGPLTGTIN